MGIIRIEPKYIHVRPKKYAREIYGFLVGEDENYYYWIEEYKDILHKFDKTNKQNLKFCQPYSACLYIIKNDVNTKLYIGQTSGTIENRYANHLLCARDIKNNKPLYEDMRKYGVEHFQIEKLMDVLCSSNYIVTEIENHFIRLFDTQIPNGYNIRCGINRNNFDYLWKNIYKIKLNENSKYYNCLQADINKNFMMDKWDKYRDLNFSNIYEDMKKDKFIEVKLSSSSKKIIYKCNITDKSKENLEKELNREFRQMLKEALSNDKEIEEKVLNWKKGE